MATPVTDGDIYLMVERRLQHDFKPAHHQLNPHAGSLRACDHLCR